MSFTRKLSVRGIVVGRRALGEGSATVDIYADSLGLISALAQSSRLERSQLRPHLQVATRGTFSLAKGRGNWRTTGAVNTENAYFACADSPEAQRAIGRVLSFVRQFVYGEGSDPYFFSALSGFFDSLPYTEESVRDAECLAVLRMLASLGYIEETDAVAPFLDSSYDTETLTAAHARRAQLLKAINEGMNASGLSA